MLNFGAVGKIGKNRSYSKECQDLFAYYLVGSNGTFLDLGCWYPDNANNTMLLEEIGWSGLLFDVNMHAINACCKLRSSRAFCVDVTSNVFEIVLDEYWSGHHFDYISLDVDKASFSVLEKILARGITFKCMTFEHDYYALGDILRKPSREALRNYGYVLLFEDVKLSDGSIWEDWWIRSSDFAPDLLDLKSRGESYDMCVKKLSTWNST